MPLFDYRCAGCGAVTEIFSRQATPTHPVPCARCGSTDTAKAVSSFAFRATRADKYNEAFRERMTPFLKSQPETRGAFEGGGESDEARAYRLTEKIGESVDKTLQTKVFDNLK